MRLRTFLWISLGLNALLAGGLFFRWDAGGADASARAMRRTPEVASGTVKTNFIVRRQFFSWQELESSDYPTYIANLRTIGCPDQTIRDIIVADVNQLYGRKKALEIVSADQQWWRSEPDLDVTVSGIEKVEQLEAERRELLTRLLGAGWEFAAKPASSPPNTPLDGPVLGLLSQESRQVVKEISERTEGKIQEYAEGQRRAGRRVSQAELAKIRQQFRNELSQVLNPAQMEEYLLRYSHTAERLRDALAGVDVSPDEFRRLFQARDQNQMQLDLLSDSQDAATRKRAAEMAARMEEELRQALGPERYEQHRIASDDNYRSAHEVAESAGVKAELVQPIYDFLRTAEEEKRRIREDATLDAAQQASAMARMEAEYLESLRKLLGDAGFARYMQQRQ
jgi:hypothetical protein